MRSAYLCTGCLLALVVWRGGQAEADCRIRSDRHRVSVFNSTASRYLVQATPVVTAIPYAVPMAAPAYAYPPQQPHASAADAAAMAEQFGQAIGKLMAEYGQKFSSVPATPAPTPSPAYGYSYGYAAAAPIYSPFLAVPAASQHYQAGGRATLQLQVSNAKDARVTQRRGLFGRQITRAVTK